MTGDGRIKVLQFPIANSKGGITQYALQNWKFIDKSKFQFDFATLSQKLDFEEQLKKSGAGVFYISCSAEQDKEQFSKEFRNILIKGNYDVIHLHTGKWKSLLVEEIAKELGIKKVILHAHSTGIDILDESERIKGEKRHNEVRGLLNESVATDYWACSLKAADFLYGDRIPREKIVIMNNAIDLSSFEFDEEKRMRIRKELGVADDEIIIGNVGRLSYTKNQGFLLRVFNEICKFQNNYKLLLVGDGELKEDYFRFVKENHLEGKVLFLGFRKDVNQLLQAMDVFCLPSRFEGFGMVLVEAQASGLLCLASNNIPNETEVSDLIEYLPLKEEEWVNKLLNVKKKTRVSDIEKIRNHGYDIKDAIKKVEMLYMNMEG